MDEKKYTDKNVSKFPSSFQIDHAILKLFFFFTLAPSPFINMGLYVNKVNLSETLFTLKSHELSISMMRTDEKCIYIYAYLYVNSTGHHWRYHDSIVYFILYVNYGLPKTF